MPIELRGTKLRKVELNLVLDILVGGGTGQSPELTKCLENKKTVRS